MSWNGFALTGYAPDSFIRISRNSDVLKETIGAAGELALTKVADKTGTLELELLQTSETNLILSAILLGTEFEGDVIPVGQFILQDLSGSVLVIATNTYLKQAPEIELGADQNSKVWTFGCEELRYSSTPDGFNPEFTGFSL